MLPVMEEDYKLAALRNAQSFIADELDCRERSLLPTKDENNLAHIEAAKDALADIEGAIYKAERES